MRSGSLPAGIRPALHALLPLPELPATDRKRVRDQPADRGRPGASCSRATRSRSTCLATTAEAADLPLPDLPGRGLQPVHAPEFRYVRAGTLDEPSAVSPDVHIFTRSKVGGSRSRTRCRRSRCTTRRRSSGRPRASNGSRPQSDALRRLTVTPGDPSARRERRGRAPAAAGGEPGVPGTVRPFPARRLLHDRDPARDRRN